MLRSPGKKKILFSLYLIQQSTLTQTRLRLNAGHKEFIHVRLSLQSALPQDYYFHQIYIKDCYAICFHLRLKSILKKPNDKINWSMKLNKEFKTLN